MSDIDRLIDAINRLADVIGAANHRTANDPAPPAPEIKPPDESIEDLFSVRTLHCLRAEHIHSVVTLTQWTERDLLRIPSLGKKSLRAIKEVLAQRGLSLQRDRCKSCNRGRDGSVRPRLSID